ncbi:hypothetical protein [Dactylosporangium vinaceum]|uniref:Uncharacterized protein n=1 Tax=Dactylosporangium vinaceum TaxID=53362 RepID=A0ABV5M9V4_9ACTN
MDDETGDGPRPAEALPLPVDEQLVGHYRVTLDDLAGDAPPLAPFDDGGEHRIGCGWRMTDRRVPTGKTSSGFAGVEVRPSLLDVK